MLSQELQDFKDTWAGRIEKMSAKELSNFWQVCIERLSDPNYAIELIKLRFKLSLLKKLGSILTIFIFIRAGWSLG